MINTTNLQKMADYIRTIPQDRFDMSRYRHVSIFDLDRGHLCNTVGCIIGHCTVLDPEPVPTLELGATDYFGWSQRFTGLYVEESKYHDDVWTYLFYDDWEFTDNTPEGAAARIEWFLAHGLPKNWEAQMHGDAPLSYK